MNSFTRRILGITLIIVAIGGLIISSLGLYGVWHYKPAVQEAANNGVVLLSNSLEVTGHGLEITQQSLEIALGSINALHDTVEATANTINNTQKFFDSIGGLLENTLPVTLSATQSSLEAAQKGARVIDTVLRTLTFFKPDLYNPEKPLHQSLGEVSESINDLPGNFLGMSNSVDSTSGNLDVVESSLRDMATDIDQITTSLERFANVVAQYQETIDNMLMSLERLENNLPTILNVLAAGLTLFLLWMAFAQIGLLTQGWELTTGRMRDAAAESLVTFEVEQLMGTNQGTTYSEELPDEISD